MNSSIPFVQGDRVLVKHQHRCSTGSERLGASLLTQGCIRAEALTSTDLTWRRYDLQYP